MAVCRFLKQTKHFIDKYLPDLSQSNFTINLKTKDFLNRWQLFVGIVNRIHYVQSVTHEKTYEKNHT